MTRVCPATVERLEHVPVGPLRDRYRQLEARGVTASDICRELGWFLGGKPDVTRLKRRLGITPNISRGERLLQTHMGYEMAVALAKAMDLDPFEAGV